MTGPAPVAALLEVSVSCLTWCLAFRHVLRTSPHIRYRCTRDTASISVASWHRSSHRLAAAVSCLCDMTVSTQHLQSDDWEDSQHPRQSCSGKSCSSSTCFSLAARFSHFVPYRLVTASLPAEPEGAQRAGGRGRRRRRRGGHLGPLQRQPALRQPAPRQHPVRSLWWPCSAQCISVHILCCGAVKASLWRSGRSTVSSVQSDTQCPAAP